MTGFHLSWSDELVRVGNEPCMKHLLNTDRDHVAIMSWIYGTRIEAWVSPAYLLLSFL